MSQHHLNSFRTSLAAGLLCIATAGTAAAQVPEGWAIVSRFLALESLSVVSPRTNQAPIPLTNVPDEIKLTINVSRGANAVAINRDGIVAVGNASIRDQDAVVLYTLQLDGLSVVGSQRYELGRSFSSNGNVPAIEALPDGRFLFSVAGIYNAAPMNGRTMGILDPATGTVTPLSLSGVPMNSGRVTSNSLAVSHDGSEIFIGQWTSSSAGGVYRVPITGGTATLVGTTPHGVVGIDVDNTGNIVLVMNNAAATGGFGRMDIATGTFTPVAGTQAQLAGCVVEHATGNVFYAGADRVLQNRGVTLLDAGISTTVGTFSNGTMSDIDINNSPRSYGTGTPGTNNYRWVTRDNPGGVPLMGNASFSLSLDSTPSTAQLSLLAVGVIRGSTSLLGIELLVDPATLITLPLASTPRATVALPIPNDVSLTGLVFHAQSLHLEAGGALATSGGISFGPMVP